MSLATLSALTVSGSIDNETTGNFLFYTLAQEGLLEGFDEVSVNDTDDGYGSLKLNSASTLNYLLIANKIY